MSLSATVSLLSLPLVLTLSLSGHQMWGSRMPSHPCPNAWWLPFILILGLSLRRPVGSTVELGISQKVDKKALTPLPANAGILDLGPCGPGGHPAGEL